MMIPQVLYQYLYHEFKEIRACQWQHLSFGFEQFWRKLRNYGSFEYFHMIVEIRREPQIKEQNLQIILFTSMKEVSIIIYSLLTLSMVMLVYYIIPSATRSHQVKPHPDHSLDSAFIPTFTSNQLLLKTRQLEKRIKTLQAGSSCAGQVGDNCEQLKKQFNMALADADTQVQQESKQRLIYETRWNTTCQIWRNQSERLLKQNIYHNQELTKNSIKIQSMANQISFLNRKIKNSQGCVDCPACSQKICPKCPEEQPVNRPDLIPCPKCQQTCAACDECQECLHCHDQDYNQLQNQYTILQGKFQECGQLVEQYRQKQHQPEDCGGANHEEVKTYLKEGLASLNRSLQNSRFGSLKLKDIVANASKKLNKSHTIKDSISIVPTVITGLTNELQEIAVEGTHCGDDNHRKIVDDCMDLFKKAVIKLKDCQNKLAPFIVKAQT